MELALQEGVFFRFGESNELHCFYLLYFYYMPFPAKVKLCTESLQAPSQALRASSPSRGASGETVHFAGTAKASPTRRGGIASAMTERLYEGKLDREPLLDSTSPSRLRRATARGAVGHVFLRKRAGKGRFLPSNHRLFYLFR